MALKCGFIWLFWKGIWAHSLWLLLPSPQVCWRGIQQDLSSVEGWIKVFLFCLPVLSPSPWGSWVLASSLPSPLPILQVLPSLMAQQIHWWTGVLLFVRDWGPQILMSPFVLIWGAWGGGWIGILISLRRCFVLWWRIIEMGRATMFLVIRRALSLGVTIGRVVAASFFWWVIRCTDTNLECIWMHGTCCTCMRLLIFLCFLYSVVQLLCISTNPLM